MILKKLVNLLPFKWRDCKLKTVSYGHGVTTTPIQLPKVMQFYQMEATKLNQHLSKEFYGNKKKKF